MGVDYRYCQPCSHGCKECVTAPYLEYEFETCSGCVEGKYLLGLNQCVDKCPKGWVGDDLLGWCVKCSCECEECENNRDTCTVCKGDAYLLDGKCVTNSEIQPYAKFFDSDVNYYAKFYITYNLAGINLGYRSDFDRTPYLPILTCHDSILNANWNDGDFANDLEAVKRKIREMITQEEFDLLERIGKNIKAFPPGFNYKHADETTANPWKIYYLYADSLFGFDWTKWEDSSVITDVFPQQAVQTLNRGEIYSLCEEIFVDDGYLWEKIGRGALCWFNQDKSCDADAINR